MHPPDKKESQPIHRLYVLRLWREGASAPWRASVKQASTGKETHFANLESLCVYLQSETAPETDDAAGSPV